MRSKTLELLWVAFLMVGGCAEDSGGAAPNDGEQTPSTIELEDLFNTCTESAECVGGEICSEGFCREACSLDGVCEGALGTCDTDAGICIECSLSSDCAGGERCESGVCLPRCVSSDECGAGWACAVDTGLCVVGDCTEDLDCVGGQVCSGGLCREIGDVVCSVGAITCQGTTERRCNADGSSWVETSCGGDGACLPATGCSDTLVCTPNAFGCHDERTAWVCSGDGGAQEAFACRDDESCDDGVCRRQTCEPNSLTCRGDAIASCDGSGHEETIVACSDDSGCEGDAGCYCDSGACRPRVCLPGIAECAADGVRVCNDQGSGYLPIASCSTDSNCQSGRCVPDDCNPGDGLCSGAVALTCNADGETYDKQDCGLQGTTCAEELDGSAACAQRLCEPDAVTCASPSEIGVCNSAGTQLERLPCADGLACEDARCLRTTEAGFEINLLWVTEGDPNPDDTGPSAGSDLDLHVVHPSGSLGDPLWDCYWFNGDPDWGNLTSTNGPKLARDDTDGRGPETFSYPTPLGTASEPLSYRVAVHYYEDHAYGPSDATLTIALGGDVVSFSRSDLVKGDLWDVATITWPSMVIETTDTITPDFVLPIR